MIKFFTNLADRDQKLSTIEEQIKKRQKLILKRTVELEETKKENQFLEHVYKDYRKYHTFIIDQKKQQIEALYLLQEYLDNLKKVDDVAKHEIDNLQNDQTIILKELDKVRNELNELIV